jgi:mRNA-degrading endonuclease RelE of RelBE toxin-antitoxin system
MQEKFRVFRSFTYKGKLLKLDRSEQIPVEKFEQHLKDDPFSGQPLGYKFFREKKFGGKRLLFLVYEEHKCVFLITITDKKAQQYEIDMIKANLDVYRKELDGILRRL